MITFCRLKMTMYLVQGLPFFEGIRTIAPDGTTKEIHSLLSSTPPLVDNGRYELTKWGQGWVFNKDAWTQHQWQEFFSRKSKETLVMKSPGMPYLVSTLVDAGCTFELPSLPTLTGVFLQIREALYDKDKPLQGDAEELRDDLRKDYKGGSLPTSTRVRWQNKTITHRVDTPDAYELQFNLPPKLKPDSISGFYKIKELMEKPEYRDELIALFGQKDMGIVYKALTEVINDEPFLVVYNSDIGEIQESSFWACTTGEVRVDDVWTFRKLHRDARGIILVSEQREAGLPQKVERFRPLETRIRAA